MVANEYAKALYELASNHNKADLILEEFKVFCDSLKENKDFIKLLTYPTITNDQKKECLETVLNNTDELFLNFMKVLVDNGRVNQIFDVYDNYYLLWLNDKNIVNVKIISSHTLSEEELSKIKTQLSSHYKKDVVVENLIDNSLIAGYKFIANGEEVDFSIVNKLTKLKKSI